MSGQTGEHRSKTAAHHEHIYQELRQDILSKRLVGGEKLLEAELAKRFRVSRTPVREALYKLERDGLVNRAVNVGVTVAKNTDEAIAHFLGALTLLESEAARLWATCGHASADLERMETAQEQMKAAFAAKDVTGFESANRTFHRVFLDKAPNPYLADLVEATREKMFTLSIESYPSALHIEQYIGDHDLILQAARRGDPDAVAQAVRAHLENVGANIRGPQ